MTHDGSPVSEPLIDKDEDPNEGERQVEESDLVTEESREIGRDQLRRRLTSKQSRELEMCQSSLLKRKKKWNRG